MPSGRQQFVVSNIHQPQRLDDETFLVFDHNDFTKSGETKGIPNERRIHRDQRYIYLLHIKHLPEKIERYSGFRALDRLMVETPCWMC